MEIHTSADEWIANEDCSYMFSLGYLTSIDFGNKFNSSNVKDMSWMFSQCQLLDSKPFDLGKM